MPAIERTSTGNAVLDGLIDGGLPTGSLTLVAGLPGSGKTVLALQMMFAAARSGARCLYFTTVSEPAIKLLRYARAFDFFDEALLEERVSFLDLGGVLVTEGPGGAVAMLQARVEEFEPQFLVIDSFRALHDLLGASGDSGRSYVYKLAAMLSAWGVTTLLVGEYPPDEMGSFPEFAIVDGVLQLGVSPVELTRLRSFEVRKLRGSDYVSGEHFFEITSGGLRVYPRVRAPEANVEGELASTRLAFGLTELDTSLGGGLAVGSTTLLEGATGTGKTLLALQYLREGALAGETSIHFGLEETPGTLRRSASSAGFDLAALERGGALRLFHASPVEMNPDRFLSQVLNEVEANGAKRVVLDSISALGISVPSSRRYRELLYAMSRHLQLAGVTTIMTAELPELLGSLQLSGSQVSSIADTVILLRYIELGSSLHRTIGVLKSRGTAHTTALRRFYIDSGGPRIGEQLTAMRGVLTGQPTLAE